jgi:hypothetical protein
MTDLISDQSMTVERINHIGKRTLSSRSSPTERMIRLEKLSARLGTICQKKHWRSGSVPFGWLRKIIKEISELHDARPVLNA